MIIDISPEVHEMMQVEGRFLVKMDIIVNEYDAISQEKVKALKQKEYILLIISLAILFLEILFLFQANFDLYKECDQRPYPNQKSVNKKG